MKKIISCALILVALMVVMANQVAGRALDPAAANGVVVTPNRWWCISCCFGCCNLKPEASSPITTTTQTTEVTDKGGCRYKAM